MNLWLEAFPTVFFGMGPAVLRSANTEVLHKFASLPLTNILIESDSPVQASQTYQTPTSCDIVSDVYDALIKSRTEAPQQIYCQLYQNAQNFFCFDKEQIQFNSADLLD